PSLKVQLDSCFDDIVLRALEGEPDKRYQHARDLKADLRSLMKGGPGKPDSALALVPVGEKAGGRASGKKDRQRADSDKPVPAVSGGKHSEKVAKIPKEVESSPPKEPAVRAAHQPKPRDHHDERLVIKKPVPPQKRTPNRWVMIGGVAATLVVVAVGILGVI